MNSLVIYDEVPSGAEPRDLHPAYLAFVDEHCLEEQGVGWLPKIYLLGSIAGSLGGVHHPSDWSKPRASRC